jgi:hypothetical protein
MTFGESSQEYLGQPTFSFLYRVKSDSRTRQATTRAETSEAAKAITKARLDKWHGENWEWA